ncbi:MAG: CDP-diacylglycerol--glycerol-3-phosphate 3-phosphatidyltransferase [Bacilli bacterium]|nr:CDP-diacylglycerol--glycerol-3-phosphate 3-phosphatidyltransferase [Bacilli bacterium]MDD2681965.1 CDP-diacylglycerol--glycerol-3-phosphate 3-phosphatidyltransferase [Bacilli bacterium]MDD3120931.1 CDP-diacylglycerol--glycerol-3-phosphate 3-phosphatidyltransferase [Bacilli bacterium]MDD4063865.1 CDP-diacylglycerol--glycerol-3-phosphate 3-phosphatidyltransferase [Bacilli bacterium]MDD4481594.1 CDP-diacylglycerol--glycerol-3-phosphate 3-phosphatidyltransferase [Bacilli bacterium]
MNLPNKLTMFRIMLIPVIIIISLISSLQEIFLFSSVTVGNFIILIIFCVASFTDFLDGNIARKRNLVTDFGKFMDPLADKLLVISTMIILLEQGKFQAFNYGLGFVLIIIIAREFIVTGIRLLAVQKNIVIAASSLGKVKTISQIFMIIILLLECFPITLFKGDSQDITSLVVISIAGLFTLVSGIDYFIKNKELILKSK